MTSNASQGPNAAQAGYWLGAGGERWSRLKAPHDAMLTVLTEQGLEIAGFAPGQRVLDLGCGTGLTTFEIARQVAPSGSVTGVDFSETMLAPARAQAAAEPDLPIRFVSADVQTHDFTPASFDVAFSRFGVMFYADPARAFAGIRRALVPGGRLAFVCWREVRLNTWASDTIGIARNHLELPPRPGPEDPGPYSFRKPERVRRILGEAGWSAIAIEELDADAYMGADLEEAVTNCQTMGPIADQILAAPEATRAAIAGELRQALPEYVTDAGVIMRAACWMVTAEA